MSSIIKLYVSCHKEFYVPKHELLFPIQVGKALETTRIPNMLYDDSGNDNISLYNRSYCELTGQYWAWKNDTADYYGFFHYRRYLSFEHSQSKFPYLLSKTPSEKILNKSGYSVDNMRNIIINADIVAPIPENTHMSVYEHYKNAPHHRIQDLDYVINIIEKDYPTYIPAMEQYLNQSCSYFGNIYIMKKEIFFHYCEWLFDILGKYDLMKNVEDYSVPELRVDGYLAERLFGIYITKIKEEKNLKVTEVQRLHFECVNGSASAYWKKKLLNFVLPPSSKRRFYMKKLVK